MTKLTGGCLCGAVEFELKGGFSAFYQCHCKQCQKLTGSAFASNLFTKIENVTWLKGQENISRFEHPTRSFSKQFCQTCGSALPFVNKSKTVLIVPAGSLEQTFDYDLQANIFVDEEACWTTSNEGVPRFSAFPE